MVSIILATISLVIFYKLFRAFGRTQNIVINIDGNEREKFAKIFEEITNGATVEKPKTQKQNPLHVNILKLQKKIPSFSPVAFLKKAEEMFDTIFDAFVNAKHYTLQSMLSKALYEKFSEQIKKREENNLRQEMTIKHNKTSIATIKVLKTKATLVVKFDITQMSAIIKSDGTSIDNPGRLSREVLHTWIFERSFCNDKWILSTTSSIGK
ncbi:MAG: Tim44 domain-containing protein [Holosporales bacterium]|jgi:predicted lipid-binding transport protein (Tim44 family)|nr:Tim44 domain-containing protein [Holosporales bacterium]